MKQYPQLLAIAVVIDVAELTDDDGFTVKVACNLEAVADGEIF